MRDSTGVTKHPRYDRIRLAMGLYRAESFPKLINVASGGGDDKTPWEGLPQIPAKPLNRVHIIPYHFMTSEDVDTTNKWTLTALNSGSIALAYDTGGTPCVQIDTDNNLNDYTYIQTKIGTTQFETNKDLWAHFVMKLDSQSGVSAKSDVSIFLGLTNSLTSPANPWNAASLTKAMCFIITGSYAYSYVYESGTAYSISSPKNVSWSLDTWTELDIHYDGISKFFAANDSNMQGNIDPGTTVMSALDNQSLYMTLGIKTLAAQVSRLKVSRCPVFRTI